ncbi:MAG: hypothetical protein AAB361_03855 [Patescibacteria group bacterium]
MSNYFKKCFAIIILVAILTLPIVVQAAWWNPFSWNVWHKIANIFYKPQAVQTQYENKEIDFNNFDTPKNIEGYELVEFKEIGTNCVYPAEIKEMEKANKLGKNYVQPAEETKRDRICSTPYRATYNNDGGGQVQVKVYIISDRKKEFFEAYHKSNAFNNNGMGEISPGVYIGAGREPFISLYWFPKKNYDIIFIDQYVWINGKTTGASIDNPVINYYLKKYPPLLNQSFASFKARIETQEERMASCKSLDNKDAKNTCFWTIAIKYKNINYCEEIFSIDKKENCYIKVAELNKDSSVCGKIALSERNKCYLTFAKLNQDPELCEKISDQYFKEDTCYSSVASFKNPDVCSKIKIANRDNCYLKMIINPEICIGDEYEKIKDLCKPNPVLCNKINDIGKRNECFHESARRLKDIEICKNISTEHTRELCERFLQGR